MFFVIELVYFWSVCWVLSTLNLFSLLLYPCFVSLLIRVLKSCIYYGLRPNIRCIDVCEICISCLILLLFGSTVRYGHNLGGWRCRLNLSMFLLTISIGRFWSVQSVLEFNAIKKNLRIMSDIERDRSIPCGFSRVFALYTERLQSRKELVCM